MPWAVGTCSGSRNGTGCETEPRTDLVTAVTVAIQSANHIGSVVERWLLHSIAWRGAGREVPVTPLLRDRGEQPDSIHALRRGVTQVLLTPPTITLIPCPCTAPAPAGSQGTCGAPPARSCSCSREQVRGSAAVVCISIWFFSHQSIPQGATRQESAKFCLQITSLQMQGGRGYVCGVPYVRRCSPRTA